MPQKVALNIGREAEIYNFLDKLSSKVKKVYSRINEETLYVIVQNYPGELINDTFNGSNTCKGLNSVVRWKFESYTGLNKYETNKNHVLSLHMIVEEFLQNFSELQCVIDFFKVHEIIVIHDIGEIGPGDRTVEEKLSSDLKTKNTADKLEQRYATMLIGKLDKYGIASSQIKDLKEQYLGYEENKSTHGYLEENFVKFIDSFQGFLYVNFEIITEEILSKTDNEGLLNKLQTSWNHVLRFYDIFCKSLEEKGYETNVLGDLQEISNLVQKGDKEGIKKCLMDYNPNIMNCIKI
ncbi:hypothetical protein LR004_01280 [Candidatus Gracilibacteria bacterium]|nr:hypothetical protein [Candidatus Gracilibacteria bacterium]